MLRPFSGLNKRAQSLLCAPTFGLGSPGGEGHTGRDCQAAGGTFQGGKAKGGAWNAWGRWREGEVSGEGEGQLGQRSWEAEMPAQEQ